MLDGKICPLWVLDLHKAFLKLRFQRINLHHLNCIVDIQFILLFWRFYFIPEMGFTVFFTMQWKKTGKSNPQHALPSCPMLSRNTLMWKLQNWERNTQNVFLSSKHGNMWEILDSYLPELGYKTTFFLTHCFELQESIKNNNIIFLWCFGCIIAVKGNNLISGYADLAKESRLHWLEMY